MSSRGRSSADVTAYRLRVDKRSEGLSEEALNDIQPMCSVRIWELRVATMRRLTPLREHIL